MALGAIGLVTVAASSASATTITETFGSGGPTGPLELQIAETINQPTSVVQGSSITLAVQGGSQTVPTSQSGAQVNYISGLTTIIPIPAQSAYLGNVVGGTWSYTPPACTQPSGSTIPSNLPGCGGPTTTGAVTITHCTASGTGCTAMANGTTIPGSSNPVVTWAGPTLTDYVEESTGSAQFLAGGSLTLPNWSFDVTATGNGSIVSSVAEFDTVANVTVLGSALTAAVEAYPAAPQAGCLSTPVGTCNTPVYQLQPIATTTILSPPAAPVLAPQTGNVSAGQCTTINPLTGATDTGSGDSANPASVAVVARTDAATVTSGSDTVADASILATDQGQAVHGVGIPLNTFVGSVTAGTSFLLSSSPTSQVNVTATANGTSVTIGGPLYGTTSVNPTTGIITYCNTGGSAPADTFQVTAADTLANPPLVSAPVTETIDIAYNQCSAGSGNATGGSVGTLGSCSLHQAIILPVTAGQIILSQANGLPFDFLGSQVCAFNPVPGITLNGNEQAACGVVSPLTITNATGLDSGWTLTGQVSDFNDPADPSLTCDSVATYSNHCIPGGNLSWEPAAAVAQSIVPGDTAVVTPGATVPPFSPVAPALPTNALLAGVLQNPVQPNPVVEPAPNAGLQAAPQTMCSTLSGQSGGTFVCGAGLELLVPASVAEPAQGAYPLQAGQPAPPEYQATLTVTLQGS